MYDLGLDYKKGGLFNRAAEAFDEVLKKDPRHIEAARQIATLYEEMRDWEAAFEARKRLDKPHQERQPSRCWPTTRPSRARS